VARSRPFLPAAVLVLSLAACISGPRQRFQSTELADRAAIDLAEIVVTVRTEQGPRNLHVWYALLIQPLERLRPEEIDELEGAVRRSEGRIAAQATEDLAARASVPTASLGKLRGELANAAQKTLDDTIARWRFRRSFRIEAAITSLYFTDGSVGRARAAERWW
jgi:hypothetical protein